MSHATSHSDTFVIDNLPPIEQLPQRDFSVVPELNYPERLNCAIELLDRALDIAGDIAGADRVLFYATDRNWTYGEMLSRVNRIAHVLTAELGLEPGNRVLLRGPNTPEMAAVWFAVVKAGGICVTTMPLLRRVELEYVINKAKISHALCDSRWTEEFVDAASNAGLERWMEFNGDSANGLDRRCEAQPDAFDGIDTHAEDPVLIGFTSGTTGTAKATIHTHRDVMAICDCFPRYVLKPGADDIFTGTPPFGFTFGLGALLLFPIRFGASIALVEKPGLSELLSTVERHRATICFTSPTAYRASLGELDKYDISSLEKCVSAGETLPLPTFESWRERTGIKIIDGIGATELLHIFISSSEDEIRPGATGKVVPGYQAKVVDESGNEVAPGTIGLLAVRGPTGCRYLSDKRQAKYVQNGWNLTGDAYYMDEDGYFWFHARADDMIISGGYNISGIEVERVLLGHAAVQECAVVGVPDQERGMLVKAFVILKDNSQAGEQMVKQLQDYVKSEIAPYKYPRAVDFVASLPRTETGKLQRFKLR